MKVEPRVLSFDIETDAKGERLLAISMYAPGIDEVLIVDGSERADAGEAIRCANEFAALDAFCERIRDVRSRRADRLEHHRLRSHACCSGSPRACVIRSIWVATPVPSAFARPKAISAAARRAIPGRLVLDGIDLLRGAFVRMDDYSLDAVAREVLGEGKAVAGDVRDRIGEIMHNYRHDLPAFALYARTDARLAYRDRAEAEPRAARLRAQPADAA